MFEVRTLYLFFYSVRKYFYNFWQEANDDHFRGYFRNKLFLLVELSKLIERTLFEGKLDNKKKKVSLE